ncbi:MAG: GerAB/ArcD/ProY family transporter [Bacillota bacterium]
MEKGKISGIQVTFLMVWTIVSTGILYLPITISRHVTKDAWMIPITFLASIFIALISTNMGLKYPGQTVIQYSQSLAGKIAGKGLGLILIFWFVTTSAIVVREFGEFIVVTMPSTPMIIMNTLIVLLACYAVKSGLEVMGRVSELLFPVVFFSITVVIVLVFGEVDLKRLLPMFDRGILPVIRGTMTPLSYGGEIITIMMLIPFMNKPASARKSAIFAVLIVASIGAQIETITTAVFGESRERMIFQHFHLIRMINVAQIFERMDIVFVVTIFLGIFVKLAVLLYCSVLSMAQWLNLKTYKPLVLPTGVIVTAYSILFFENINKLIEFLDDIFPPYALTVEVGIPSILLILFYLKRYGGKKSA